MTNQLFDEVELLVLFGKFSNAVLLNGSLGRLRKVTLVLVADFFEIPVSVSGFRGNVSETIIYFMIP